MMGGMGNRSGAIARVTVAVCALVLSVLPGTAGASSSTAGPADGEVDAAQPAAVAADDRERLLLRAPRTNGADLAAALKAAAGVRSARKAEPVRIELDPRTLV